MASGLARETTSVCTVSWSSHTAPTVPTSLFVSGQQRTVCGPANRLSLANCQPTDLLVNSKSTAVTAITAILQSHILPSTACTTPASKHHHLIHMIRAALMICMAPVWTVQQLARCLHPPLSAVEELYIQSNVTGCSTVPSHVVSCPYLCHLPYIHHELSACGMYTAIMSSSSSTNPTSSSGAR